MICFHKQAMATARQCPCKRAFFIAEQFTVDELVRNSRAVDIHKFLILATAGFVNHDCQDFFARAAFPFDKYGVVALGSFLGLEQNRFKMNIFAD